jgi:hypothetical protein
MRHDRDLALSDLIEGYGNDKRSGVWRNQTWSKIRVMRDDRDRKRQVSFNPSRRTSLLLRGGGKDGEEEEREKKERKRGI